MEHFICALMHNQTCPYRYDQECAHPNTASGSPWTVVLIAILIWGEHETTRIPHFIVLFALLNFTDLFFYKSKVCGNPVLTEAAPFSQ